jgi:hypothetical protein
MTSTETFAARLGSQVEFAPQDAPPAATSEKDEFDRAVLDCRRMLQAQSALRFHLGQTLRVLEWRIGQLARLVSP